MTSVLPFHRTPNQPSPGAFSQVLTPPSGARQELPILSMRAYAVMHRHARGCSIARLFLAVRCMVPGSKSDVQMSKPTLT